MQEIRGLRQRVDKIHIHTNVAGVGIAADAEAVVAELRVGIMKVTTTGGGSR
mgnify:CR=1 FL=1